jgi:Zn-dependent M32 family carboxypeptidase
MNVYERFALSEYLYAFPEDKSYDEVLDMYNEGSDEVLVWEVFERMRPEAVVEFIDALRNGLMATFIPREEDK